MIVIVRVRADRVAVRDSPLVSAMFQQVPVAAHEKRDQQWTFPRQELPKLLSWLQRQGHHPVVVKMPGTSGEHAKEG